MQYLFIALIGYGLGCSNMAVYLAALKGVDLRAGGSGNPGASNAMILMGWKAGVIVGLHDIGKAVAAVLVCELLFPAAPLAGAVGGVACVLGHMFPFYLRFHGGKGFASYLGMALALNWRAALVIFLAVVIKKPFASAKAYRGRTSAHLFVLPAFFGSVQNAAFICIIRKRIKILGGCNNN